MNSNAMVVDLTLDEAQMLEGGSPFWRAFHNAFVAGFTLGYEVVGPALFGG